MDFEHSSLDQPDSRSSIKFKRTEFFESLPLCSSFFNQDEVGVILNLKISPQKLPV